MLLVQQYSSKSRSHLLISSPAFLQNDRMAVDMGIELRKKNVCVVSLWPGAVITELIGDQIKQGHKVGNYCNQL